MIWVPFVNEDKDKDMNVKELFSHAKVKRRLGKINRRMHSDYGFGFTFKINIQPNTNIDKVLNDFEEKVMEHFPPKISFWKKCRNYVFKMCENS